jgi:hypothetical protein
MKRLFNLLPAFHPGTPLPVPSDAVPDEGLNRVAQALLEVQR